MSVQAVPATEFDQPMIEMNTTPLIDVLLVLLIMFIITIPIQTHAVKIDLPRGIPLTVDRLKNKIVIDEQGAIFWNGQTVTLAALTDVLVRAERLTVAPELHIEPDALAPYRRVDEVLAVTKRVGVGTMGFVGNERYRDF